MSYKKFETPKTLVNVILGNFLKGNKVIFYKATGHEHRGSYERDGYEITSGRIRIKGRAFEDRQEAWNYAVKQMDECIAKYPDVKYDIFTDYVKGQQPIKTGEYSKDGLKELTKQS